MTSLTLPGVPFALVPDGEPACGYEYADGVLRMTAAARTDLFVDPAGTVGELPGAGRLVGLPPGGDFSLAARVTVDFGSVYDAGVLVLYASERRWAKLCFEYSPQKLPTAVTVVTRGTSDDSNSFEVEGDSLWLRVTRGGRAWAFHASTDGRWWRLLRYFGLDGPDAGAAGEEVLVGFLVQSPTGRSCTAAFEQITFTAAAPADLRDGS